MRVRVPRPAELCGAQLLAQHCDDDVQRVHAADGERLEILLAGTAKLFVGSIVEDGPVSLRRALRWTYALCGAARARMDAAGVTGPIPPRFLREAYRRIVERGGAGRARGGR